MTALRVLWARLLGRGLQPAELDAEWRAHVDLLTADLERTGLAPGAARLEARRRLGNVTALQESYREQRRLPFLEPFAQDLRYALRQLRRNPGFAAAAVLTLALGIGANVAIYQALDAVVFRQLPVRDPAGLVQVLFLENGSPVRVSYPLFRELSAQQKALEGVFAVSDFPLREAVLRGRGGLRGVKGALVSGGYFHLLGVSARRGRMLRPEDDRPGAPPVAVLSDAFWAREFERSPAALGQTLHINNAAATVIGVAPPEFFGETVGSAPDVWLPIALQPQVMPGDWLNAPSSSWLTVMGRLRPRVAPAAAEAEFDPLFRRLTQLTVTRPGSTYRARLQPASRGVVELQTRFEQPLWLLQGIAGLSLLIACSNLAGLLLARATARGQEIGVRLALGAGSARLIRQLLTESLAIGALGAAAAIPLAIGGTRSLVALASQQSWRLPVAFGWRTFAFTLAISAISVCLFGLAPALAAARVDVHSALQAGRGAAVGTRARLGRGLIAAQIAIALVILSCASLLLESLWNLRRQDFGFDAAHVIAADVPLEFTRAMMKRHTELRGPLLEAASRLPGVRSAAVSGFGLLGSMQQTVTASTPTRPMGKDDFVRNVHVSDHYFETLGIPLLAGRAITPEDRENTRKVVVISQTAAKQLFGAQDPVGRLLSTDREYNAKNTLLVIGVAQDVRFAGARDPFGAVLYVPMAQNPAPVTAVLLRPSGSGETVARSLRAAIARVDPNLRVGDIRPLEQILEAGLGTERSLAVIAAGFAAVALGLTSVGVYGVIAYAVRRRTREIGVRLALGAERWQVTRLLLGGVLRLLVAGLAMGAAGAFFAIRALRGSLFGIAPYDVAMPLLGTALLIAVALLAGYLPARRAARLDPMDALRIT